jgi:putative glutamine amidotransferase
MKDKKVYVIGAQNYANWLGMELTFDRTKADLIMFTGGEDVSPELYGDRTHRTTYASAQRDITDIGYYKYAIENDIPMLGICRGSQFLTVMQPKGRLIQDVENHAMGGTHDIEDIHGNILAITSTHHQMHYPFDMDDDEYELIAWANKKRSSYYAFGDVRAEWVDKDVPKESEIIYYNLSRAMGIQGHPEHLAYDHVTNKYLRELVKDKLQL